MLVMLHTVICHSTLASGIGTSRDRKYKLTIGVKLKKGLRKPCHCFNHMSGMYVGNIGRHAEKKCATGPRHTKNDSISP